MMSCFRQFFVLLFFLFAVIPLGAQQGFVSDATDLLDPKFFKNEAVGKQVQDIYHSKDTQEKRIADAKIVLLLTEKEDDRLAEMVTTAVLGMLHFDKGDYKTALDYYSQVLSLDSAVTNKTSPLRERSIKILANSFGTLGAYKMSVGMLHVVISIGETRDREFTTRMYHYYTDMAGMMNEAGYRDSSLFYFRRAIEAASKQTISLWLASAHNNLGYNFLINQQTDSASAHFRMALNIFVPRDSAEARFRGSITDNLGQALVKEGKYSEALLLFRENVSRFRNNDHTRYLNACAASVSMLIQLSQKAEARQLLTEAEEYIVAKKFQLSTANRILLLGAKRDMLTAEGKMNEALVLTRTISEVNDSLLRAERTKKIAAIDFFLADRTQKFRTQIEAERLARIREQESARYSRLLLYAVAVIGILLLSILFMLYRRRELRARLAADVAALQRKQTELELAREQLETEKLNRELELKRRDVTDMAIHIAARKKLSEEWLERLKKIKSSAEPDKELQALILELRNTSGATDENRLLPENVEQVNHEFYEKLKSLYPDLTRSEIDLCGLIRMRIPMKEVARLRNISSHAVRVAKHRLKKKMGLPAETELDEFITRL